MLRSAHELQPGDSLTVCGSTEVVVAEITRCDSKWISNGVVYFIATNGIKYGLSRYDHV